MAKVVSAQLLVQKGNRYLQLRVKSPLAKAKVRIVLIGKNGKTSRIGSARSRRTGWSSSRT